MNGVDPKIMIEMRDRLLSKVDVDGGLLSEPILPNGGVIELFQFVDGANKIDVDLIASSGKIYVWFRDCEDGHIVAVPYARLNEFLDTVKTEVSRWTKTNIRNQLVVQTSQPRLDQNGLSL